MPTASACTARSVAAASNGWQKFSSVATIPGFVVYQRAGGLTDADKTKIAGDVQEFGDLKYVAKDQIGAPTYSKDGTVAAVAVPLVGKDGSTSTTGPQLVDAEKAVLKLARAGNPDGLVVHSAGAGGILVAFIGAVILLGFAIASGASHTRRRDPSDAV